MTKERALASIAERWSESGQFEPEYGSLAEQSAELWDSFPKHDDTQLADWEEPLFQEWLAALCKGGAQ